MLLLKAIKSTGIAGAFVLCLLLVFTAKAQVVQVTINAAENEKAWIDSTWYLKEYTRGQYVTVDSAKPLNGSATFMFRGTSPAIGKLYIPTLPAIELILQPKEKTISLAGNYSNFRDGSYIVLNSNENQCRLTYKREEKEFNEFFSYAFNMVQNTTVTNTSHALFDSAVELATAKHNRRMKEIATIYAGTFCANKIIPNRLIPARSDKVEWLKQYSLNDSFLRTHYLDYLQWKDADIINLPSLLELLSGYRQVYIRNNIEAEKTLISRLLGGETHQLLQRYLFAWFLQQAVQQSKAELVSFLLTSFPEALIKQSEEEQAFPLALKNILPGNKAFDIQLPDTTGVLVKLSELAKRHRQTLLFFYSHDCDHCRQTIQPLREYCSRNGLPETSVLAVDLHPDAADWKQFVAGQHLPFTNVHLTETTAALIGKAYAIVGTPTLLLVDSNLVITELYPDVHKP